MTGFVAVLAAACLLSLWDDISLSKTAYISYQPELLSLSRAMGSNVNCVEDLERHNRVDSQSGCYYTLRVQS